MSLNNRTRKIRPAVQVQVSGFGATCNTTREDNGSNELVEDKSSSPLRQVATNKCCGDPFDTTPGT